MKPLRIFALVVAFGPLLASVVLPVPANGKTDRLVTVVESSEYRIVPGDHGQKIVMKGFGYRMVPGEPMLPEKDLLIALPPGARVLRVEARGMGGTLLSEARRIMPTPPVVPLAEPHRARELAAEMQREWQENYEATYATDDAYPRDVARITGSGSLRRYAYAAVSVCPFAYQPLSGRLMHFDAVHITVPFQEVRPPRLKPIPTIT
jgi:hypothetical protein